MMSGLVPHSVFLHNKKMLEQKAIKLYKKGKLFGVFSQDDKNFFREVAELNEWENLKKEIDK